MREFMLRCHQHRANSSFIMYAMIAIQLKFAIIRTNALLICRSGILNGLVDLFIIIICTIFRPAK